MSGGRPLGVIPSWATDENYAAGPAWGNTPTKVEPGAGRRATGFAPNDRPPAQHVNQQFGQLGQWIDYLDAIQAQNFSAPAFAANAVNIGEALSFDPLIDDRQGRWFAVGPTKSVYTSPDGLDWTALAGIGAGTTDFVTVASSTIHADGLTIMGGNVGANANRVYEYINGAWSSHDLAGVSPHVSFIYWAEEISLFIVGGVENGIAKIWTTPDGVTYTARTVPDTATSALSDIIGIAGGTLATGSTLYVAISQNVGSPALVGASWSSPDGITWTLRDFGTPAILRPVAIAFSKEEKAFLIVNQGGGVYRSVDGINWSLVVLTGQAFIVRGLCCKGSLWMAVGSGAANVELRYVLGSATTHWKRYNAPRTGSVPVIKSIAYGQGDGRFMTMIVDIGNDSYASTSLRLGDEEKQDPET